ncbi:MAG: TOBE domain-containing protein [Acidobacteriaceae bacterium]
MKISARNVLAGKVERVTKGAVNAEVDLKVSEADRIAAIITNGSVDALGLKPGDAAYAVIKASDVMIGKDLEGARLSARNVLSGTVAAVHDGAVNSEVTVRLSGGAEVAASITKASVHNLELKPGDAVSAVIKASNVMVGVDHQRS